MTHPPCVNVGVLCSCGRAAAYPGPSGVIKCGRCGAVWILSAMRLDAPVEGVVFTLGPGPP